MVRLDELIPSGNFGRNRAEESDEEWGKEYPDKEEWIKSVWEKVNLAQPTDHPEEPCAIFEVPNHIQQLENEAYKPIIVCLGPFRRKIPGSYITKYHKRRCVRLLLLRHRSQERARQLLSGCLLELKKHDEKVRSCYSQEFSKLNAQDMAMIMLLDGCFIIYLMLKMCPRKESRRRQRRRRGLQRREGMIETREGEVVLNIEEDEQLEGPTVAGLFTIHVVIYDLLKLENQIPFFIIRLLFDHLKTCEDGQIDLVDLALQLFKGIHPEKSKSFEKKSPEEYHHLLHLFYSSRIPSEKPAESTSAPREDAPKWIPSATELLRAGVKFRKKEQADSFLNIQFQRRKMKLTPWLCLQNLCLKLRSGRMEIPQLQIYGYTGPLFQNLIAFEQCYFDTEMYFTIYALFMDCIIDQAEDVRLLQLKGILEHKLSSPQDVADLFNQLGSRLHYVREKNYLAKQIKEVNSFYEVKCHKRLVTLRRDYLGNPWAKISVFAAALLLFLTIEQAVFSALSYFHSP
ncbi:UPF0481 protein At3g47200-like [Phoenix dactylifera]|uniref:UPF0481 protein At3g47200-like n=1 Tax=Phoenix dactylifera TaxID=42345 RepID=A0A8B9AY77_PHODC|nr:UPF0481 protein At3g47200-like [Phoenix dactylifera]